jgi:phosphinothricin acetyltransferase
MTMTSQLTIRPATLADLAAITDIYAYHVIHGTASFELEAPDHDEIQRRWRAIVSADLPYLVAEVSSQIAGYAYAGPYRPRAAYRDTVEDSIYLHPSMHGRGYGRILLSALIAACEAIGLRQMVAVIGDSATIPSIRLHETLGFRHVGVLRDVGYKHGRWLDSVLLQRTLGAGSAAPPNVRNG